VASTSLKTSLRQFLALRNSASSTLTAKWAPRWSWIGFDECERGKSATPPVGLLQEVLAVEAELVAGKDKNAGELASEGKK